MAGALIVHDKDHRRLPPDVVLLMTQVLIRRLHFLCCGDWRHPRHAQVNLVADKARNYAWASYASGSKLPVVRGKGGERGVDGRHGFALAKQSGTAQCEFFRG